MNGGNGSTETQDDWSLISIWKLNELFIKIGLNFECLLPLALSFTYKHASWVSHDAEDIIIYQLSIIKAFQKSRYNRNAQENYTWIYSQMETVLRFLTKAVMSSHQISNISTNKCFKHMPKVFESGDSWARWIYYQIIILFNRYKINAIPFLLIIWINFHFQLVYYSTNFKFITQNNLRN